MQCCIIIGVSNIKCKSNQCICNVCVTLLAINV